MPIRTDSTQPKRKSRNARAVAQVVRVLLACLIPSLLGVDPVATGAPPQLQGVTKFASDRQLVNLFQSLQQLPAYGRAESTGPLISRSRAKALLDQLEVAGWSVKDRDQILERVLPDNDPLFRQSQTRRGRQFFKQIQSTPGSIDRLDRITRMPHGEANLEALVQTLPNGPEVVTAMIDSAEGRRMSKQMSRSRVGRDLMEPTRRIYTLENLVLELQRSARFLVRTTDPTTTDNSRGSLN